MLATLYGSLSLDEIVMHQVRRVKDGSETKFETMLTDEPIVLQPADRDFLTQRFVKVLSGRGLPIVENPTASPLAGYVRGTWFPQADFVELSKQMTTHLAATQPGNALPGLLVVARGKLAGDELVLVSKVEHQEAMRLEPSTNAAGHQIFTIERLKDLVFGDTAKIYKIAILSKSQSAAGVLSGEIVDEQNGFSIAAYFLGKFMGMKLREEPAVLTERFLDKMTSVINKSSLTSDARLDLQSALVSELASNRKTVDPESFIRDFVPKGHGPEIKALAADEGAPLVVFGKDTQRVSGRMSRLRVDLSNDVHVIAPPELVGPGRDVSIEHSSDGDRVLIQGGRVSSIKSSGGR